MTRAASEGLASIAPGKRFLLFSRSSCIGMHRYGGVWTGDNHSWWSHLLLNLKMLPSLNMCGFLYVGADLGLSLIHIFNPDPDGDLCITLDDIAAVARAFVDANAGGGNRTVGMAFSGNDIGDAMCIANAMRCV